MSKAIHSDLIVTYFQMCSKMMGAFIYKENIEIIGFVLLF